DLEQGGHAVRVIPGPDEAVGLADREAAYAVVALRLRRDRAGIGDAGDRAGLVILPGVERAFDVVAVDPSAMAHMGAQMPAIGIQQPRLAVLATPQNEVAGKVAHRLDLP